MTTTDHLSSEAGPTAELPELDLEPTRVIAYGTDETEVPQVADDSTAESSFSSSQEMRSLLRTRLFAVTLITAIVGGLRYLFSLFVPDSGEGMAGWSLLTRALFSVALAVLLGSRQPLSYFKLRAIEYLFVGLQALAILGMQYVIGLELISRGDIAHAIAFDKNCIIRIITLILMYGVLIPNKPQVTARVVLTIALGPILVLAAMHAESSISPMLAGYPGIELATSNALFVVLSAGVAIAASYLLNDLQTELHGARRLGQYQLGEKLGEGGMGEVYMAEHQLLKRPCALKLIKPGAQTNPIALARFEREVQSAAALSHPNTIQIYDYGHAEDGTFYYVMEYLSGLSLSDLIHQFGALPPGRAVYIMIQVCKSLQEAHRMGMVHRDLKPANIFIAILGGKCDVAKVLDFGLVKVADSEETPNLTTEYTVSGTPAFMSPEQASGMHDVNARADLYALGAILYYMVTGAPPFEKPNPMALMIAHASEPVVPPSRRNPAVPADLEAVIVRCMSKKPEDRYADAREYAAALASCACAADWDESRAEEWWLQQAESHTQLAQTR